MTAKQGEPIKIWRFGGLSVSNAVRSKVQRGLAKKRLGGNQKE